jgi:hypothetical protein
MTMQSRTYPLSCRSLYCGETTCPQTCPHLSELQEFKAWRTETKAIQIDPIWAPTLWCAQN